MASQHFVPQMLLRRMARQDGRLWELRKDKLCIGTKPRSPRSILCCEDGFTDLLGDDLDRVFFGDLETSFSRILEASDTAPNEPRLVGADDMGNILGWALSVYVRSPLTTAIAKHAGYGQTGDALRDNYELNCYRSTAMKAMFDGYRSSKLRMMSCDTEQDLSYPIGDNAVVVQNPPGRSLPVLAFPTSRTRWALLGLEDDLVAFQAIARPQLDLAVFAFAEQSVFCADKNILQNMLDMLSADPPCLDPDWVAIAKQPIFGAVERVGRSEPGPAMAFHSRG